MTPLSEVLRDLFGTTRTRGTEARSAAPVSAELGQVRWMRGLVPSLRAAIEVARAGNGAIVFSTMRAEVLTMLLLLAETSPVANDGDPLARVDQRYLDTAADRVAKLPIWIDDVPLTVEEFAAKIRQLASEFDGYTSEGKRVERLALVLVDDWKAALENGLSETATELEISMIVVQDTDGWPVVKAP